MSFRSKTNLFAICALAAVSSTQALAQMDGAVSVDEEALPSESMDQGEAPDVSEPMLEEKPAAEPLEYEVEEEPMMGEGAMEAGPEELGDEGAMLPGGLDDMGTAAGELTELEGKVSAVDSELGMLEVETKDQGLVSLRANKDTLEGLVPGQSVSLTYEERDGSRWIRDLAAAGIAEPTSSDDVPAPTATEDVPAPTQAEAVQQPAGKRMSEGGSSERAPKSTAIMTGETGEGLDQLSGFSAELQQSLEDEAVAKEQDATLPAFDAKDDPTGLGMAEYAAPSFQLEP